MRWVKAFVILAAACAPSQRGPASDLLDFARFVRDAHPAPWRFVTATAFDAAVATEATALESHTATELEVDAAFQRALAALGDSHVAVTSGVFQPGAVGATFLPLLVVEVEGTLYVDAAPDPRLVGKELVSIDGVSVAELRAKLVPLVIRDGTSAVSIDGEFTKLYHFAFGMRPRYRVVAGDVDAELAGADRATIHALGDARQSAPVRGADRDGLPFALDLVADTTWIRIPTFGSPDESAMHARIDRLFERTASALVLDVRGNQGGFRTHGIAVLDHVLAKPFAQWTRMTARIHEIPEAYRARVRGAFGTDPKALRGFPEPATNGVFAFEGDPLAHRMVPTSTFAGPVVALVDGRTNSAANEMVIALKHARPDAIVVGTEPGGNCAEHVGEVPVTWTTPSGVTVLMSLVRLELVPVPGCMPGRGLVPDVAVVYTKRDFANRHDPYERAVATALHRAMDSGALTSSHRGSRRIRRATGPCRGSCSTSRSDRRASHRRGASR